MTDQIRVDASQVDALAGDLSAIAAHLGPFLNSAMQVTATKVRDDARKKVRGRRHFKQAAQAIDYDVKAVFGQHIEAEVGYDKDRPVGELGNLVEFGAPGARNALAPGDELRTSLADNADDLEKGIGIAVEHAQRKAGL